MKITSKVFFRSFLLSFAIFAIVAGIIIASLYTDKISIDPTKEESNVLVGISHNGDIISVAVLSCDPKNNIITFLTIPDNTILSDGSVLQEHYVGSTQPGFKTHIEKMIGAKIDRYLILSVEAISQITNEIGRFEYLIPYKFTYNDIEHSGQSYMNGELAFAMFTYNGYDKTKVSLANIGDSYLRSFLTKHGNPATADKIAASISNNALKKEINTNISSDELVKYCDFIARYSTMLHSTVTLEGEYHTTNENIYFYPSNLNSDHNIFKK